MKKVYLEKTDLFSPVQYWYLYKDGTIKNRYDDKCLTSGKKEKSDLFMSECKDDNLNQKWEWNKKTNRIVSKDIPDNKKVMGYPSMDFKKFVKNWKSNG